MDVVPALRTILCAGALVCALSACTKSTSEKEVSLTLYIDKASELLIQDAVARYENMSAGEVQWNFVDLRDLTPEEFQARLCKDMESGKGPDIVFLNSNTCADPYLAMQSGYFMDLSEFITSYDIYEQSIMKPDLKQEGYYQGIPYLQPIAYTPAIYLSAHSVLEQSAFAGKEDITLPEFMAAAEKEQAEHDISLFDRKQELRKLIRQYGGSKLIDYETKKVQTDSEEWETLCRQYQVLFLTDQNAFERESAFFSGFHALSEGKTLFTTSHQDHLDFFTADIRAIDYEDEEVLLALRSEDHALNGTITTSFGINANTTYREEAFVFVEALRKVLRPGNIRGQIETRDFSRQNTFVISSFTLDIDPQIVSTFGTPLAFFDIDEPENNDSYRRYNALLDAPAEVHFETAVTKEGGIIDVCMEPFFRGEESYEVCSKKLYEALIAHLEEGAWNQR